MNSMYFVRPHGIFVSYADAEHSSSVYKEGLHKLGFPEVNTPVLCKLEEYVRERKKSPLGDYVGESVEKLLKLIRLYQTVLYGKQEFYRTCVDDYGMLPSSHIVIGIRQKIDRYALVLEELVTYAKEHFWDSRQFMDGYDELSKPNKIEDTAKILWPNSLVFT